LLLASLFSSRVKRELTVFVELRHLSEYQIQGLTSGYQHPRTDDPAFMKCPEGVQISVESLIF
jgi:hypothetical protein